MFSDALGSFVWSEVAWSAFLPDRTQRCESPPGLQRLIYAANPNLIYLQATAMTESLYLALFIWAVVYFNEFRAGVCEARRKSQQVWPRHRLLNAGSAWRAHA